jgi:hypothetical protein
LPGVCERSVLPLRPRTRNYRPHRRYVLLCQTSLVEHQQRSESGSGAGDLRHNLGVPERVEVAVEWTLQVQRELCIRTCRLGAVEGREHEMLASQSFWQSS